MSFSVSPAANFPELEPDDFCPKLSTPCIVLFPDDDDDIFDEICNKKKNLRKGSQKVDLSKGFVIYFQLSMSVE